MQGSLFHMVCLEDMVWKIYRGIQQLAVIYDEIVVSLITALLLYAFLASLAHISLAVLGLHLPSHESLNHLPFPHSERMV